MSPQTYRLTRLKRWLTRTKKSTSAPSSPSDLTITIKPQPRVVVTETLDPLPRAVARKLSVVHGEQDAVCAAASKVKGIEKTRGFGESAGSLDHDGSTIAEEESPRGRSLVRRASLEEQSCGIKRESEDEEQEGLRECIGKAMMSPPEPASNEKEESEEKATDGGQAKGPWKGGTEVLESGEQRDSIFGDPDEHSLWLKYVHMGAGFEGGE